MALVNQIANEMEKKKEGREEGGQRCGRSLKNRRQSTRLKSVQCNANPVQGKEDLHAATAKGKTNNQQINRPG